VENPNFNLTSLGVKCPYCGEDLVVITPAVSNAENHLKPVKVRSECCHRPITLSPKVSLSVIADGNNRNDCDNWGQPYDGNSEKFMVNELLKLANNFESENKMYLSALVRGVAKELIQLRCSKLEILK